MQMKKQFIIVGITLLLLAVGFCGCTQEDKLKNLGYKNTTYGFGLNPPQGWTVNETDQYGAVRFYGPITNNFTVNIGVTKPLGLNETETLSSGIDQILLQLPMVLTNFTLLSRNIVTVNGLNGEEIIYTFMQGALSYKGKQVYIQKNKTVYCLTYTALVDSYDTYNSVVEQSITSFTVV
jgi:hypothetical protein